MSLHIWKSHQKQLEAKRIFEEQERQIDAQVHAMVMAKKREFALVEQRQRASLELQKLANDIEHSYDSLSKCGICGQSWEAHRADCPMNVKRSTFDEILDFATNVLSLFTGGQ